MDNSEQPSGNFADTPPASTTPAVPDILSLALDRDGRITSANPAMCALLGYTAAELIGLPWFEKCLPQPQGMAEIYPLFRQIMAGRLHHAEQYENPVRCRDGSERLIAWRNSLVTARDGQIVGALSAGIDVTERKQTARLLAMQSQAMESIIRGAPLNETLDLLAREAEAMTPGMIATILLLDPVENVLRPGAAPSLPDRFVRAIDGLRIGPDTASFGTAAWRGEPVFVHDIETDPLWDDYRDLARQYELRACWAMPIHKNTGAVLGTLATYFRHVAYPNASHRLLLDHVRRVAAIAIEKAQEDTSLRRYAQLVDAAGDMLALLDTGLRCRIVNPAYANALGRRADELIGQRVADIVPPAVHAEIAPYLAAALAGQAVRFTIEIPASGAAPARLFDADYHPHWHDGQVDGIVTSLRDVTEQRTWARTLQRQADEIAQRNRELERFNVVAVGRELDMIALKRQINDLSRELGRPVPFNLDFADDPPSA